MLPQPLPHAAAEYMGTRLNIATLGAAMCGRGCPGPTAAFGADRSTAWCRVALRAVHHCRFLNFTTGISNMIKCKYFF